MTAKLEGLQMSDDETFYDKKSSFFDNISCEIKERTTTDHE